MEKKRKYSSEKIYKYLKVFTTPKKETKSLVYSFILLAMLIVIQLGRWCNKSRDSS